MTIYLAARYDRKNELASRGSGTSVDRDTATAALIQAKQILEFVRQQQATTMVKLGGRTVNPFEPVPPLGTTDLPSNSAHHVRLASLAKVTSPPELCALNPESAP